MTSKVLEVLRDDGLDLREAMPKVIDIIPTKESVKEMIWKPVMMAMFHKQSTTQLNKSKEIDKVVDVITKALGERGISIPPFPSWENIEYIEKNDKNI